MIPDPEELHQLPHRMGGVAQIIWLWTGQVKPRAAPPDMGEDAHIALLQNGNPMLGMGLPVRVKNAYRADKNAEQKNQETNWSPGYKPGFQEQDIQCDAEDDG